MEAKTIEEYIDLYKSGIDITKIKRNEEIEKKLVSYLEEHKEEANDLLLLYARCLEEGIGTKKNIDDAVKIYINLSEKEYARAQNNLGNCYYNGRGVVQDYSKAVYWYEKSAEQGNALAQCKLGACYYSGKGVVQDYNKAVYWYEKSANQGFEVAQDFLGVCYEYGDGVTQDYSKAVYWYEKSAEQGETIAQCKLGVCYDYGRGVAQDYSKAVYWYEKAAEQGDVRAQCNLGYCYEYGQGIAQDYSKAVYWYEKAANQEYARAQNNLGNCYYNGRGVVQDYSKAVYWYEKSAEQGKALAQCKLGACYYSGKGVVQDYSKAVYWYEKAAEQGDVRAQCNLGYCYEYGQGIAQDYSKAVYWYEKAAEQGYAIAQCNLGIYYENGKGVAQDYSKAVYWYEKAAEQEYVRAYKKLSAVYSISTTSFRDFAKQLFYEYLADGQSKVMAYYNVGFRYYWDENINHNKYKRYEKALEYVTKAFEGGLQYAKDLKEKLEELYAYEKSKSEAKAKEADLSSLKGKQKKATLHLGKRKDVFISWNHNDIEIKDKLYKFIEENSYFTCWESDRDCNGHINEVCKQAIWDSSLFIVILTENSLKSQYVAEEIETMLEKIKKNPSFVKCIKPILINRYNKKGKIKEDVYKKIEELKKKDSKNSFVQMINDCTNLNNTKEEPVDTQKIDSKNPFVQIQVFGSSFDPSNFEKIIDFIKEGLQPVKIEEYKSKIIKLTNVFEGALQNTILTNQSSTGAFSTTFEIDKAYIKQPLYKDNIDYSIEEILECENPVLIYGEGGLGKSLYIKNMVHNYFNSNKFFFYLTAKEILSYGSLNFYEVLSMNFESYSNREIKSLDCVKTLLENNKNIYIIIDALDEIEDKANILKMISAFSRKYKNVHYIFTSRNSSDANLIANSLSQETLAFTIKGMSKENIEQLYDNLLKENVKPQYKNKFLKYIDSLDDALKRNPMIVSNLIISYFISGKLPNKMYEVINNMISIVFEIQEKDRDASFKYKEYLNVKELNKLLEFIAYSRAKNIKVPGIKLLNMYYDSISDFKDVIIDKNSISEGVNEYLSRRSILLNGYLNHQMYSDYFASAYCYSHIVKENNFYIEYVNERLLTKDLINNITLLGEHWNTIIEYMLLKLDYEVYINGGQNQNNIKILIEIFKSFWIDISIALQKEISKLIKRKQLYFYEELTKELEINHKS